MPTPFFAQLIDLAAAALLLLSFALLAQRRVHSLINLLAGQGLALFAAITAVAVAGGQVHLYASAALTLLLKVFALPWILRRLARRLGVQWQMETLVNLPSTLLLGLGLVIFAFGLAQPISQIAATVARGTVGIALAVVLLAFLMMITRRTALSQVVGFLAMENGLFFAATAAAYGMPMAVEFGVALDVLVGVLIFGVFFFQIRERFDSLDLQHLESLKES